jgi:hypothetical protein
LKAVQILGVKLFSRGLSIVGKTWGSPAPRFDVAVEEAKIGASIMTICREIKPDIVTIAWETVGIRDRESPIVNGLLVFVNEGE